MSKVVDMRRFSLAMIAIASCCSLAAAEATLTTSITVSLPADALLEVNGQQTSSIGTMREFRDSQAKPGAVYRYLLRASFERDGRRISQERLVRLRAGEKEHVIFQFAHPVVARKKLTAPPSNALAQASTFQPRFQPRTTESGQLPDLPATKDESADTLPPIGGDGDLPAENNLRAAQPEGPTLDVPARDTPRFGRQFGEDPELPDPADNDLPPLDDDPVLRQPRFGEPPSTPRQPHPDATQSLTEKLAVEQSAPGSLRPLAYLGHDHFHQFMGNTGSALHVWQHRWRMVRLERVGERGPYSIYREIDHRGYDWAYGRLSLCGARVPVFFKPGNGAAWCFVGYAQRVRPFSN